MNKQYVLEYANQNDVENWMRLVILVKDNFPGLDIIEYEKMLVKNINRQTALCVKYQGQIVGVLLFSINSKCLSCMAVHPYYRLQGIGSMLVGRMLELFPKDVDISVTTFRENDELGIAPRALYRKYGFVEDELTIEHGYPNQRFILHRN